MSIQAPNADKMCEEITGYLGEKLSLKTEFIAEPAWQEREQRFDAGEIHVGWICGLPYVRKADASMPVELLAAPVMAEARYANRPVYFSDVMVHRNSTIYSFDDLHGVRWAFNEPNSHSGYAVVRYYMATFGKGNDFLGEIVESGSHQQAIKWLAERRVDASAIDSTVLSTELAAKPKLAAQLRRIGTLGPSPIPPWVIHMSVPPAMRQSIREALLGMANTSSGRQILDKWGVKRFARVADAFYNPIRMMEKVGATLSPWK